MAEEKKRSVGGGNIQWQLETSLPILTSPFVGREKELETLNELLTDTAVHLVTILGPGGIGKTRLAIEAAFHVSQLFRDNAQFVDLHSVTTCEQIVDRVVEALSLPYVSDISPFQHLLTTLSDRELLLILDNFEHLLGCSEWVTKLLEACPSLTILVTSREPLNLGSEWLLELTGLAFPEGAVGAADAQDFDAIRLFTLRAKQVKHDFSLAGGNNEVFRICKLVEGMPLAIELAASWIRTLSPREIAAEIQHNLNILHTRYRNAEHRHRSIEAVFDQSWKLLTPDEQAVFTRLTIFRGGFSRDVALRVADVGLDDLDTLIDKSLVRRHGENWYNIHELLRQYGEARLQKNTVAHQQVLKQCASYYARFLHRHAQYLGSMRGGLHLDQLGQEINNIQRALNYLLSQERVAEISDSLIALLHLYQQASWLREGHQDFSRVVEHLRQITPSAIRDMALARALIGLGCWLHCLNSHKQAIERLEESINLLNDASKPSVEMGLGLLYRARAARAMGNTLQAEEGLSLAHQHFETVNWDYGIWLSTIYAAELAYEQGAFERARDGWSRALSMSERWEHVSGQVLTQGYMALAKIQLSAFGDARQHLLAATRLCQGHHVVFPVPMIVAAAAILLDRYGEDESSAQLVQLAQIIPAGDFQVRRYLQPLLDRSPQSAESQSPRLSGIRYTLDTISKDQMGQIEQILSNLPEINATGPVLTPREREVLQHLIRGATNREIAMALNIAEGTVKRYTHNLFAKLGAQNRAEAVYRASELNLI